MKKGTKLNVILILFWLNSSWVIYALRKMHIIVSDIVMTPHFVINIMTKIMLCPLEPNFQSQLLKGQLILNPRDRCLWINCASCMAFFIHALTVLTVDHIESSRLEHSFNFVPFMFFSCELHFLRWPNSVQLFCPNEFESQMFHFNLFNSNFLLVRSISFNGWTALNSFYCSRQFDLVWLSLKIECSSRYTK